MILSALRGRGQGIYKIQLTQPINNIGALKVTLGEGIEVPVTEFIPFNPANNRKTGTLVTFVQAAMGENQHLRSEDFDKEMAKYREVVKPTVHQYHKGTQMLNGNRFCVVDVGKTPVPSNITILSLQIQKKVKINTRYKGQKWWCRRCQGEHVGPCESLQSFYAAKDARAKENIQVKVLSDSTLRRAEQIGLRADILCMSGAGVGHLANALRDDPAVNEKGELGMILGQNDVRNSEGAGDLEYIYTIDRSVDKVRKEMDRRPNQSLAIFVKVDDPRAPTLSPDLARREQYLEREIGGLASDRVTVTKLPTTLGEDATGHLNDQGTVEVLDIMDRKFDTELMLNPAYLVSERLYAGVQTAYRYGCRTCHQLGQFGNKLGICLECILRMDDYALQEKWDKFIASLPSPPPPPGVEEEPPEEENEEIYISDISRGNTPKRVYEGGSSSSDTEAHSIKKMAYASTTQVTNTRNDVDLPK